MADFDLEAAIRAEFPTATPAERELIALRVRQRAEAAGVRA